MSEINESLMHEFGHACIGVIKKVPVIEISCDPSDEQFLTYYGYPERKTHKEHEHILLATLYIAGPATDTLMFGGYDIWRCRVDGERSYKHLYKAGVPNPEYKWNEIFDYCFRQISPFYADIIQLEQMFRFHKKIKGADIDLVTLIFENRLHGISQTNGSEDKKLNHCIIPSICKKEAGA